jgi:protein-S-isoprenylcysteine O-methyltransferase Ste14
MTEKLGKTLQLLFVLAVIFGSHYMIPIKTLIEPPTNRLGLPLILAGVLLDVWAASLFRERRTSFKLQGGAASLITDGPFGFSRNPMYLGITAALLGLAVFLGSLMAVLYPALFFCIVSVRRHPHGGEEDGGGFRGGVPGLQAKGQTMALNLACRPGSRRGE